MTVVSIMYVHIQRFLHMVSPAKEVRHFCQETDYPQSNEHQHCV